MKQMMMGRRLVGACGRAARVYHSTCTSNYTSPVPYRHHILFQRTQPRIPVIRYKQTLASTNPNIEEHDPHENELPGKTKAESVSEPQAGTDAGAGPALTSEMPTGARRIAGNNVSVLNGVGGIGDNSSFPDYQDGNRMTLFHKPSHNVLNVNLNSCQENGKDSSVTLFLRPAKEVINLTFRADAAHVRPIVTSDDTTLEPRANQRPGIDSVSDVRWKQMKVNTDTLMQDYMKLAKIRLTGLVVITSMAGYAMAPGAFSLSTFALCSVGTALQSASANSINQFFEVPYDSQMNRTKNRPIIRGAISPLHAVGFACVTGGAGLGILLLGVNPLTAGLGMANLLLYTLVYTPMKRLSISNTWLGSFVGAVPPMMGWAAATGQLDPGAWLLGAIMYAWQFPHFNALSWNLRQDYSRAGYRMTSVVNPALCKRVAFRYTVVMTGLCTLAPVLDLTTWIFAFSSAPVNAYFMYLGWNFYKQGDSQSSRALFRFSLIHIPILITLMLISKKSFGESAKKQPTGVMETTPRSGAIPNSLAVSTSSAAISNHGTSTVANNNSRGAENHSNQSTNSAKETVASGIARRTSS